MKKFVFLAVLAISAAVSFAETTNPAVYDPVPSTNTPSFTEVKLGSPLIIQASSPYKFEVFTAEFNGELLVQMTIVDRSNDARAAWAGDSNSIPHFDLWKAYANELRSKFNVIADGTLYVEKEQWTYVGSSTQVRSTEFLRTHVFKNESGQYKTIPDYTWLGRLPAVGKKICIAENGTYAMQVLNLEGEYHLSETVTALLLEKQKLERAFTSERKVSSSIRDVRNPAETKE